MGPIALSSDNLLARRACDFPFFNALSGSPSWADACPARHTSYELNSRDKVQAAFWNGTPPFWMRIQVRLQDASNGGRSVTKATIGTGTPSDPRAERLPMPSGSPSWEGSSSPRAEPPSKPEATRASGRSPSTGSSTELPGSDSTAAGSPRSSTATGPSPPSHPRDGPSR